MYCYNIALVILFSCGENTPGVLVESLSLSMSTVQILATKLAEPDKGKTLRPIHIFWDGKFLFSLEREFPGLSKTD